MKKLAAVCLLLVLTLISISAYLRLNHSGIGCADWPSCYGNIGNASASSATVGTAYDQLLDDATKPMSWATPAHRLVASVLGLLILAMTLWSVKQRRDRAIVIALLLLTVFLAWLGIHSGGLHSPAVVMGNLAGGFLMLALLGWLVFRHAQAPSNISHVVRRWTIAALLMLALQIGLGGLTSANFAASACATIPDCHGSWMPGTDLWTAFDLTREHSVSASGIVAGGAERGDIHRLHRLVAVLTLLTSLIAGILAIRAKLLPIGAFIIAIVSSEFAVGIAAILADLPVAIAVAHNWLAAILLLALLRLLALGRLPANPSISG